MTREKKEDVIIGKPIKKLQVGFENKSRGQYKRDMENAIDFNDELAELFAKKETNPELYSIGIN